MKNHDPPIPTPTIPRPEAVRVTSTPLSPGMSPLRGAIILTELIPYLIQSVNTVVKCSTQSNRVEISYLPLNRGIVGEVSSYRACRGSPSTEKLNMNTGGRKTCSAFEYQ